MTSSPIRRGRRCGTHLFARYRPTLAAADRVACEFDHERRVEFLAQAVRREHEGIADDVSADLARMYCTVQAAGFVA